MNVLDLDKLVGHLEEDPKSDLNKLEAAVYEVLPKTDTGEIDVEHTVEVLSNGLNRMLAGQPAFDTGTIIATAYSVSKRMLSKKKSPKTEFLWQIIKGSDLPAWLANILING